MNKDVKPEDKPAEASIPAAPVNPIDEPMLEDAEEPQVEKTDNENKNGHDEDFGAERVVTRAPVGPR